MNETEKNHAAMVAKLIKDPSTLHTESTPLKWGILHAAIGVVGELPELFEAENKSDKREILEEGGDMLFYCRNLRQVLELPDFAERTATAPYMMMTGRMLDHVKRITIYNYVLDEPRRHVIRRQLDEIETVAINVLRRNGFSREDALQHNLDKLLTGPNARYKGGEYSDLAASMRADKKVEEDDIKL